MSDTPFKVSGNTNTVLLHDGEHDLEIPYYQI